MNVSVFFLAAAADSVEHAIKRFVHAITIVLRPSGLLFAVTVLISAFTYWMVRTGGTAVDEVRPNVDGKAAVSPRRERLS